MEVFVTVMNAINDIIWHPVMCVFLMCAAVWFTVRLRGIQVRRFKDMVKCLTEKGDNKKDTGLSAFQAFATTVGGRVGTGNIAGTATAIFMGGPGALFWMWITAILGASTGIVECILGQAYKTRNLGELTGGPAFYMSNGFKIRRLEESWQYYSVLRFSLDLVFCFLQCRHRLQQLRSKEHLEFRLS